MLAGIEISAISVVSLSRIARRLEDLLEDITRDTFARVLPTDVKPTSAICAKT